MLRLSFIQPKLVWEDAAANRRLLDKHMEQIDQGVDLVVLPEMFTTGFSMAPADIAETMDGLTIKWMQDWAQRLDAAVTGSIIIEEDGKYYNRLLWVEPEGNIASYDKHHLFGMAGEDDVYTAGNQRLVIEWRSWKICPLICYDLRFPLWARNRESYYDLLIYVASWPSTRSLHWQSLLQARAIENQAYVAGVNRIGKDGNGLYYSGNSLLYDYAGNMLFQAINKEAICQQGITREPMLEYREKLPFLPDIDAYTIG